MKRRIIICGGNGAGKSTIGTELSNKIGVPFFDVEDYYFPSKSDAYYYNAARSKKEVEKLLMIDFDKSEEFVFATTKPNFCNEIIAKFTLVIYIKTPKDVRIKRVIDRSYKKFGDRILPGGDLYEVENKFFNMVNRRDENEILLSLKKLQIPIIKLNGEKNICENVNLLVNLI